jgi:hypothetical protein
MNNLANRTSRRALAMLVPVALAGCGWMPTVSIGPFPRTPVPAEIAAPSTQKLHLVAAATGTQIYRCDLKAGTTGTYEWTLQAPEAILRDPDGKYVGKHYAGPTWESEDGSKVVGAVDARRDAPVRSAIPWLRLKASSTSGAGTLSGVQTILRVSTAGGVAPAGGCNDIERGKIVRVDYTADYYFYVNR